MLSRSKGYLRLGWAFFAMTTVSFARPEFSGYLTASGESYFWITDKESLRSSGWIKLGEPFLGFTVDEFLPQADALILKNSSESLRLSLRQSRVVQEITPVKKTRATNVARPTRPRMTYAQSRLLQGAHLFTRSWVYTFRPAPPRGP
jgi:hypothetical protein